MSNSVEVFGFSIWLGDWFRFMPIVLILLLLLITGLVAYRDERHREEERRRHERIRRYAPWRH